MTPIIISVIIVVAISIAYSQAATVKRQAQQSGKKTQCSFIIIFIFEYKILATNQNRIAECAFFTNTSAIVCLSLVLKLFYLIKKLLKNTFLL